MSKFETWSLVLTALYDLLTFLLLAFTVYATVVHRKLPNISLYTQGIFEDTKQWGWRRRNWDFVLENRGVSLKNIKITSQPDNIGWGILGEDDKYLSQNTSEYFSNQLPHLDENEKKAFFWCDVDANTETFLKPFTITVEFDNPIFFYPKRLQKVFNFDFSAWGKILHPVNTKFDIHNVAKEMTRSREQLEKIENGLAQINKTICEIGEEVIKSDSNESQTNQ
jgi:hypothetical protein